MDGWQNITTGLGTIADKRTGGGLLLSIVSAMEARDLWRGNDLATRIIEAAAKDALREPVVLNMDDKALAEKIMSALEEIPGPTFVGKGYRANLFKARCFENAYGGGAIFPVINDAAGSLIEPLDENNIGEIKSLQVFEPRELRPTRFYDSTGAKPGEASHYQLIPISGMREGMPLVEIHESRLILFPGIRVTREELVGVEYGWGDNKLTRVRDVLNDFELTFGSAANLLQDFSQAVLKLDGLAEILGADGSAEASARLSEMNRWRSVLRAIVIDGKDSFSRETTSLAGYPDMMDRFMFRLAAAAEMPVTKLMGMAPSGLNATGEADADSWNATVDNDRAHMKPMIERLIKLFMLSKTSPSKGKEPAVWSVSFPPLSMPSEKDIAETRKLVAETDWGNIDHGIVSADEIALARYGGDTYSMELAIDFKERESHMVASDRAAEDPNAAKTTDAATANKSNAPAGMAAANGLGGDQPVQSLAFNGAQVASMVEVIKAAISKEIPRESAAMILEIAFPVSAEQAEKLLGPKNFEATKPVPPPNPFGGPPKPPAPPDGPKPPAPTDNPDNTDTPPADSADAPPPPTKRKKAA